MKKLFLALCAVMCLSFNTTKTGFVDIITDPTIVATATIGVVANSLPDNIASNDSGLIFALCVNYLMIEDKGSSLDRIAKFAASYIAGAVSGRMIKAGMKANHVYNQASPKIVNDADVWAAK